MHYFTYILIEFLHEVAYYYTQRNTKHIAFATDGATYTSTLTSLLKISNATLKSCHSKLVQYSDYGSIEGVQSTAFAFGAQRRISASSLILTNPVEPSSCPVSTLPSCRADRLP